MASAVFALTTRGLLGNDGSDRGRAFFIPIHAVRRNLAENPDDWPCFFRLSHKNTMLALRVHAETLSLPPRARFARMLLRLASDDGTVRVTQEDLG